ncbi:remorin 4.1-like [Oryza brachyantha]|uniref:remorin 4.1-like n=1 Tax=Oryza brachyantha TaxID=4533 RepID=UPI001ADA8568|nr:remorin 4.1-like [Oryza brachyantha]
MLGSDQLVLHRPAPSAPRAEPDDVDDVEVEVEAEADDGHVAAATGFRDIHPEPPPPLRQASWGAASHLSLSSSGAGDVEQFATMNREFTAMVAAGAGASNPDAPGGDAAEMLQLARIGENEPAPSPTAAETTTANTLAVPAPVERVKKEEVEAKMAAWQAEEVAKINNKFKHEEVVINGWESQQIHRATSWLAKIERKLEEERAKATEKARNEAAAARRKAQERRAEAEARRGTKTAKVLDRANFCKAAGRLPSKRSFFSF